MPCLGSIALNCGWSLFADKVEGTFGVCGNVLLCGLWLCGTVWACPRQLYPIWFPRLECWLMSFMYLQYIRFKDQIYKIKFIRSVQFSLTERTIFNAKFDLPIRILILISLTLLSLMIWIPFFIIMVPSFLMLIVIFI